MQFSYRNSILETCSTFSSLISIPLYIETLGSTVVERLTVWCVDLKLVLRVQKSSAIFSETGRRGDPL